MEIKIAKRVTIIYILCIIHIMIINLNSSQSSCNLVSPGKQSLFSGVIEIIIMGFIIITISSKIHIYKCYDNRCFVFLFRVMDAY